MEAAERLFRENGYDKTSMSDIAQAANISRKTLFNYVETKLAVVLGLADAFVGDHMPEWLETDIPHFQDARDIMTPDLDVRLKDIAEHRWLLSLAPAPVEEGSTPREKLLALLSHDARQTTKSFARARPVGNLRSASYEDAAQGRI
nr:TetR/AcrR family transcriptional regulator [Sphingobium lactosutens]